MSSKPARAILVVALLAATTVRGAHKKPTVESVGDQVMCLCGCVATLNHCPHIDCSTREEMRAMIQKDIAAGKDETAILQALAIRYGVQVLATPPARGFNLAVWILPGVGLLVGLGVVVMIVRKWRQPPSLPPTAAAAKTDPRLLAAVEKEMKVSGINE